MIQANRIDHINATVTNLNKSVEFYKDIFGLKTFEKGISNGSPYEIIGDPQSFFLCLYQGKKREQGPVNHLGIHIKEFDQAYQSLKDNGIKLYYGGIVNYPKSRSLYIKDPDGNNIELSESFGGDLQEAIA
jgi:catechol 2,3-dioxygenase-like lactoylglutathione lyase family enzyme